MSFLHIGLSFRGLSYSRNKAAGQHALPLHLWPFKAEASPRV
jgi:hypothetical protein